MDRLGGIEQLKMSGGGYTDLFRPAITDFVEPMDYSRCATEKRCIRRRILLD
jgi:hypothetical protein